MNYDEFVNTYLGEGIDYDGAYGVQCVDLIQLYVDKVFEHPGIIYANAKDYFYKYDSIGVLKENFTKISNTPDFVPQKGDIVVWGEAVGNVNGHVAIATGDGDTNQFDSYDTNWGQKVMHRVTHNYKGVLGVLRPDDQSKINPLPDLRYNVHIQDIGWTGYINEGEIAGTTGECKRIEDVIFDQHNGLEIEYRVHMEGLGWSGWKKSGEEAGTTGEGRRIEAIEINCNKDLEAQEHVQDVGWLPPSRGKHIVIGTQGKALRLEAFKVNILK